MNSPSYPKQRLTGQHVNAWTYSRVWYNPFWVCANYCVGEYFSKKDFVLAWYFDVSKKNNFGKKFHLCSLYDHEKSRSHYLICVFCFNFRKTIFNVCGQKLYLSKHQIEYKLVWNNIFQYFPWKLLWKPKYI